MGELLGPPGRADIADHDGARVQPHPDGQAHPSSGTEAHVQLPHRLDDLQPGVNRAPSVILVGPGISEVDEQAVSEVLRDVSLKRPMTLAQTSW